MKICKTHSSSSTLSMALSIASLSPSLATAEEPAPNSEPQPQEAPKPESNEATTPEAASETGATEKEESPILEEIKGVGKSIEDANAQGYGVYFEMGAQGSQLLDNEVLSQNLGVHFLLNRTWHFGFQGVSMRPSVDNPEISGEKIGVKYSGLRAGYSFNHEGMFDFKPMILIGAASAFSADPDDKEDKRDRKDKKDKKDRDDKKDKR